MNAIVPLNIAALRVNKNDNSNVVHSFKGRETAFQKLPYSATPNSENRAPTGDKISWPLQDESAIIALGTGVHLHWELPDYFRKGTQSNQGGPIKFPQVPNRWLVVRFFSLFDSGKYQPVLNRAWVVESDYISETESSDEFGIVRPSIPVPLPLDPDPDKKPYKYMGRVVDYDKWDPSSEKAKDYLPSYDDELGDPMYLTSIGFVGPAFSSYYPSCRSVFGFWDTFADLTSVSVPGENGETTRNVYNEINTSAALEFKTSYMVVGWVHDPSKDPLADMEKQVTDKYNEILNQYNSENVKIDQTPADVFENIAESELKWSFHKDDIKYTLNDNDTIKSLTVPTLSLCKGIMQEIVWNMLENPTSTYFLKSPDGTPNDPGLWKDNVEISIGNTSNEALSALIKKDLKQETDPESIINNYEYLLDALQLGLLQRLEQKSNGLFELDELLHSRSFSRLDGGQLWVVENKEEKDINHVVGSDLEATLPIELAEYLHLLNKAQKDYDQSRSNVFTLRQQLFMDWDRYIHMYLHGSGETIDQNYLNKLTNYILNGGSENELKAVEAAGKETGVLKYNVNSDGQIVSPKMPQNDTTSKAYAVYTTYQNLVKKINTLQLKNLEVQSTPNKHFWMPTDPVLLMEGNKIEPVRRNGKNAEVRVRLSGEIITALKVDYKEKTITIEGSKLSGLPNVSSKNPTTETDVTYLVQENYFLNPMLADTLGAAYAAAGGDNSSDFISTLRTAQGGKSQVDCTDNISLFCTIRQKDYKPVVEPSVTTATLLVITFTFSNAQNDAWAPSATGWNTQLLHSELAPGRLDPFLPVFLIWNLKFAPLKWNGTDMNYNSENLTQYFDLDQEAIDYMYKEVSGKAIEFTVDEDNAIAYENSVVLSRKATHSLTAQIDNYISQYKNDKDTDDKLEQAKDVYSERKILSQTLSGFNNEQVLRQIIPKLPVNNLVNMRRDTITSSLKPIPVENKNDDWYNYGFNTYAPISSGNMAVGNFGPLRSGFMRIFGLEIVDAFGQRMELRSEHLNEDTSFQVTAAYSMKPAQWDKANKDKIYLPPRIETPTRLWFRWLSATHDAKVPAIENDFIEMNTHPATSPITGWVLPNHLEDSLFFYNSNGIPIGSFGIEHDAIVYRTTPGNIHNPGDELSKDIGAKGSPIVNPHIADFMWYIDSFTSPQTPGFLEDLMATIECSNKFIHPDDHQASAGLPVLIGRPLALTRAVLSLETQGNTLPLNQSDVNEYTPYHKNIVNDKYLYDDREQNGAANLQSVEFPLRMGDLPKIDDGLVGFLIEDGANYQDNIFYSAAAVADGKHKVTQPAFNTIQLKLNANPITVTMLIDPRSSIHATLGVLPVEELSIPPDQYATTMQNLSISFFTHPVLREQTGLVLPLPKEVGKDWSWIGVDGEKVIEEALKAEAATQDATYSFSPQKILEGWLQLKEAPPVPPKPSEDIVN